MNEIAFYKQNVDTIVNEKIESMKTNIYNEIRSQDSIKMKEIENDMKIIKIEWKNKNKTMKADIDR